jgi:hypothetical protein
MKLALKTLDTGNLDAQVWKIWPFGSDTYHRGFSIYCKDMSVKHGVMVRIQHQSVPRVVEASFVFWS